jgi:4-hydroxy-tetrahydrodipicolinate synthase
MVFEHLATIGAAVRIPYLAWNCPLDMGNKGVSLDITMKLADRLPNFAGVIDSSLDWQYMIDLLRIAQDSKRSVGLVSGTDYMVSACAVGGRGVVSELAGVAPRLARQLFDLCAAERYFEARAAQERMAALRQAVRAPGVAGLKSALRRVGRDCGPVRQPVPVAEAAADTQLAADLEAIGILRDEPRGW